jgi:tryptophan-rich sensory protein
MGVVQNRLTTMMPPSFCFFTLSLSFLHSFIHSHHQMAKYPPLDIETVNNAKFDNPRRVFTRPWHVLQQWLKDPEEWISTMAAYNERIVNRDRPFQPDPLLFPSTWPPLRILICVAVVRVMTTTLWDPNKWGGYGIMREFLLQHVLYDEWYRILMKEKRVALAAVMHVLCFLSTLYLFYTAMLADGLAPVLIFPALLASMFSGWMNIVLYWERLVERQQRRGRRPRRDSRGGVEAVTLLAGTRTRKVAENKKRLNMEWLY